MSDNGSPRISIVEYGTKPADQFQAHPRNPRRHPQRQRDAVHDSLERVGWIAPVIENRRTGNLLDGHERVWQALATNSEVPYVLVDVAEADEAFVLATFDPIGALAEIDAAAFADVLRDVDTGSAAIQEMLSQMAEEAGIGLPGVPSLDELESEYGKPDPQDGWPFIRIQVSPETLRLFESMLAKAQGETPNEKVSYLLTCVDQDAL